MTRSHRPRPQDFSPPRKCGSKYRYATKLEAEQVIEEKTIIDPELHLSVYHCLTCHDWHLTSNKN